jgi:hypothetical protein
MAPESGGARMLQKLKASQGEIERLCRRFHVRRLDVFGSATGSDFDPDRSDIDFLVEFKADSVGRGFAAYFGLKEELEVLLGCPVDLVEASAVSNPYLRAGIEATRESVFGA